MTASFLRASLFTSVVAFGVAALVAGLGLLFILLGLALFGVMRRIDRSLRAAPAVADEAADAPMTIVPDEQPPPALA
jgi:zinc transporter ZupT